MCKADIGTFPPFELVEGFEARLFSFTPIGNDRYALTLYSNNHRVYTSGDYEFNNAFRKGTRLTFYGKGTRSMKLNHDVELIPRINEEINTMLTAINLPRLEVLEAWHPVLWKVDTDENPHTDARGDSYRGVALEITREDFQNYYYLIAHSNYAKNHYWRWDCWRWRGRYAHDIDKKYYMVLRRGASSKPEPFTREELWQLFANEYPDVKAEQAFTGEIYKVKVRHPLAQENAEASAQPSSRSKDSETETPPIFVCEYPETSYSDDLQLVVYDDGSLQIREPGTSPVRTVELDPNQYIVYDAPIYQDDDIYFSFSDPY